MVTLPLSDSAYGRIYGLVYVDASKTMQLTVESVLVIYALGHWKISIGSLGSSQKVSF